MGTHKSELKCKFFFLATQWEKSLAAHGSVLLVLCKWERKWEIENVYVLLEFLFNSNSSGSGSSNKEQIRLHFIHWLLQSGAVHWPHPVYIRTEHRSQLDPVYLEFLITASFAQLPLSWFVRERERHIHTRPWHVIEEKKHDKCWCCFIECKLPRKRGLNNPFLYYLKLKKNERKNTHTHLHTDTVK